LLVLDKVYAEAASNGPSTTGGVYREPEKVPIDEGSESLVVGGENRAIRVGKKDSKVGGIGVNTLPDEGLRTLVGPAHSLGRGGDLVGEGRGDEGEEDSRTHG
jgi:hypothetical protein